MTKEEVLAWAEKKKKEREEQLRWTEDQWYAYWKENTDRTHWTYFNSIQDIPDVPITTKRVYNEVIIPSLIRCGAIPKKDLIIGKTYIGACRNASEAIWDGQEFVYERYKFGSTYKENINHFEDFTIYDVFVPIEEKK